MKEIKNIKEVKFYDWNHIEVAGHSITKSKCGSRTYFKFHEGKLYYHRFSLIGRICRALFCYKKEFGKKGLWAALKAKGVIQGNDRAASRSKIPAIGKQVCFNPEFKNDKQKLQEPTTLRTPVTLLEQLEALPSKACKEITERLDEVSLKRLFLTENRGNHPLRRLALEALLSRKEIKIDKAFVERVVNTVKVFGPSLKELDLSYLDLEDQQVKDVLAACPNITHLNLRGNVRLTDEAFSSLAEVQDAPLRFLNLDLCFEITDATVQNLPRCLENLSVNLCHKIYSIENLPPALESLSWQRSAEYLYLDQELTLSTTRVFTIRGLKRKSGHMRGYMSMYKSLEKGASLNYYSVGKLPRGLKTLDLKGNELITDEAFANLPPHLESLNVQGCVDLTQACIEALPPSVKRLALPKQLWEEDVNNALLAKGIVSFYEDKIKINW